MKLAFLTAFEDELALIKEAKFPQITAQFPTAAKKAVQATAPAWKHSPEGVTPDMFKSLASKTVGKMTSSPNWGKTVHGDAGGIAREAAKWYHGASQSTKAMLGFAALGATLKGAEGAGDTTPVFDQRLQGLRDPNLIDRFNRTTSGASRGAVLGAGGAALTALLLGKFGSAHKDLIPGGLADDKEPSDFPKDRLRAGVKVEKEHTSVPAIAEEIAMDHLTEDPQYYKKLKRIEK